MRSRIRERQLSYFDFFFSESTKVELDVSDEVDCEKLKDTIAK